MRGDTKEEIGSFGRTIRPKPALDLWKVSAIQIGVELMPDRYHVQLRRARRKARQKQRKLVHELVDVSGQYAPPMDRRTRCALLEGPHDLPLADTSAKAGDNGWVHPCRNITGQQGEKRPSAGRA